MNHFPNAARGMKKLFISELISITGLFMMSAGVSFAAAGSSSLIGTTLLAIGALLSVIGIVIEMVALSKAGKDDGRYKSALYIAIGALVLSGLASIPRLSAVSSWLTNISQVLELLVAAYVLYITTDLLMKRGEYNVAKRGRITKNMVIVITALVFILTVITGLTSAFSGFFGIAIIVLSLVYFYFYIAFLSRAAEALY